MPGSASAPYGSALAAELRDDVLERFLRYVRIDTQSSRESDTYPSTREAARPVAAARDRAAGARPRGRRADRARLRARDAAAAADGPDGRAPRARRHEPGRAGRRRRPPQSCRELRRRRARLPATRCSRPRRARCSPSGSATTSSPPTGRRCSAPTTRPGSPRSWRRSPGSSHTPTSRARRARIAFTVDEEVGRGIDHLDLERFGADFAYTLDGSVVGEIENETFSAVELKVTFHGVGVHPGHGEGQARQPGQARRAVRREPAARNAVARDDRGTRGLRPPARDRGRRRGR